MKYKVIAKIMDGVIAASKNHIVCFDENSLRDNEGDSLYRSDDGIYIGQILTEKTTPQLIGIGVTPKKSG